MSVNPSYVGGVQRRCRRSFLQLISLNDAHALQDSSGRVISPLQLPLPNNTPTLTREKRPCRRQDSNTQFQQASVRRPTPQPARPLGPVGSTGASVFTFCMRARDVQDYKTDTVESVMKDWLMDRSTLALVTQQRCGCPSVFSRVRNVAKANICFVIAVRKSAWKMSAPTGRIFMKFYF